MAVTEADRLLAKLQGYTVKQNQPCAKCKRTFMTLMGWTCPAFKPGDVANWTDFHGAKCPECSNISKFAKTFWRQHMWYDAP